MVGIGGSICDTGLQNWGSISFCGGAVTSPVESECEEVDEDDNAAEGDVGAMVGDVTAILEPAVEVLICSGLPVLVLCKYNGVAGD